MDKTLIYEKKYGEFNVIVSSIQAANTKTIIYEMEGYILTQHITEYINDLIAAVDKHKPIIMIADALKTRVLPAEFQEQIQNRFWPEIAKRGVKKNPAVMPKSVLASISVNRMVEEVSQVIELPNGEKMEVALFGSMEDCIQWAK